MKNKTRKTQPKPKSISGVFVLYAVVCLLPAFSILSGMGQERIKAQESNQQNARGSVTKYSTAARVFPD